MLFKQQCSCKLRIAAGEGIGFLNGFAYEGDKLSFQEVQA
jgi:hypothetical protein